MINPRKKFKKRLSLSQAQNLSSKNIEIPSSMLSPKEKTGRQALVEYAKSDAWMIVSIHCDEYLKGFPDMIWYHKIHGIRHVETKSYRKGHFLEPTQVEMFHNLQNHGTGVWVLRGPDDYSLLWKPPNWQEFLPIMNGGR